MTSSVKREGRLSQATQKKRAQFSRHRGNLGSLILSAVNGTF